MSLHDFYKRCCAADWQYDFIEVHSEWMRANEVMKALSRDAKQSPAHQHIHKIIESLAKAGKPIPEFADVVPTNDAAALDEAIAHYEQQGLAAFREAKEADERGCNDRDAVKRYYALNATEKRLRDYRQFIGKESATA